MLVVGREGAVVGGAVDEELTSVVDP